MGAGILAVVSYNALQIGVYGLLGQQVSDAVSQLAGVDLPWWLFVFVADRAGLAGRAPRDRRAARGSSGCC